MATTARKTDMIHGTLAAVLANEGLFGEVFRCLLE
jgi:hypothetical protein